MKGRQSPGANDPVGKGESDRGKLPFVLEIKGNSLDDGPGIRTVIFFKGCPLSCSWCHNPEGKRVAQEISFDAAECVGCGTCLNTCREGALDRRDPEYIDRKSCTLCFDCADACPSGALARVGRYMAVEEVAAAVERDIPFFRTSGGGVTLSGGEPLLFMDYTSLLLNHLKEMGVDSLIETCGHWDLEEFEKKILPWAGTIYFDLKIFDPNEHKKHCGIDNSLILENFKKLHAAYLTGGMRIMPRIPLIPGITATDANLRDLAGFLKESGVDEVALLEYNPLWIEKSRKVGRANLLARKESMTTWMKAAEVRRCRAIFEGFKVH